MKRRSLDGHCGFIEVFDDYKEFSADGHRGLVGGDYVGLIGDGRKGGLLVTATGSLSGF